MSCSFSRKHEEQEESCLRLKTVKLEEFIIMCKAWHYSVFQLFVDDSKLEGRGLQEWISNIKIV